MIERLGSAVFRLLRYRFFLVYKLLDLPSWGCRVFTDWQWFELRKFFKINLKLKFEIYILADRSCWKMKES